jgi:diguanylate cyclase (GGDEF)-like protein/PAS domain S-box-containing protein
MSTVDSPERTLLIYKAILENVSVGIAFTRNEHFEHANPAFERLFGWPSGSLVSQHVGRIWPTDEDYKSIQKLALPRLSKGLPIEFERSVRRQDGSEFIAKISGLSIDPSQPVASGTVWIVHDTTQQHDNLRELRRIQANLEQRVIERTVELETANRRLSAQIDEREQMEEQIRVLADHDPLTGLVNRRVLESQLDAVLLNAGGTRTKVGVLFVDLDRFKSINDSLGHETGDALLRLVASRLRDLTRSSDILARFGGDEFVLVLPDVEDLSRVDATAARLVEELSRPYPLNGKLLHVTPSIGGSIFPQHGRDRKSLMSRADAAMYHAKSMGRRCYQMFSPNVQQTSSYRLQLQNDLYLAVTCNELILEYQPRIDLHSGEVRGNEALVRWNHPRHGLISPMEFIPIAEENGMMESIGEWILREACKQQVEWLERGLPATSMAVNLSVQQISRPGLNQTIRDVLSSTGMPAHLLEIEITETMLLHGSTEIVDALRELHQSGVRISIDDFGMGYSSLVYLKRFPLDTLKIDQTFVRDITTDPDDAIIVETIIGLAKNLRKRVIAEGVETEEQLAFLRAAGCDEYQGFLHSRPMSPAAFEALMSAKAHP